MRAVSAIAGGMALALAIGLIVPTPGTAQVPAPPSAPTDTTQNAALRAYLDCEVRGCDRDFLVTEMTWVNWMRDRLDADFHILVTSQQTGSGGREYAVVSIGQRSYAGKVDTLVFTTNPNDAEDLIRRQLLRVIGQLLLPHAARGPLGRQLTVAYTPAAAGGAGAPPARDKWDFWTFSISANGFMDGESRQAFSNFFGNVSANRTTEAWKIRIGTNTSYNESNFTYEVDTGPPPRDTTVTAIRRRSGASAMAVRSAGDHWSFGGRLMVMQSDFDNLDLTTQASAAAEWDFFPYKEFARRKLAALYTVGLRQNRYKEITIYDRLRETRPIHTLDVTYGARQPWGEADITLYGSQFLDGLKYYNAGIRAELEVRLGRGLSFEVDGALSRVRDQLYLPREGASEQEVLTRLRALQTNYRYFTFFGIRYQFGSIFNSVVNPRFGNLGSNEF